MALTTRIAAFGVENARERAVHAVLLSLPALLITFEEIYDEKGDAEAHGIAILLTIYKTVAFIYMLCDVLHTGGNTASKCTGQGH